jgi:hypothetical protein
VGRVMEILPIESKKAGNGFICIEVVFAAIASAPQVTSFVLVPAAPCQLRLPVVLRHSGNSRQREPGLFETPYQEPRGHE